MSDRRSQSFVVDAVTAGYERHLLGPLFEPWAADLVERGGLRSGQRVLDLASGIGPVARRAARAVGPSGSVVALDISSAMLARGSSHPSTAGSGRIVRLVSSAEALGMADAAVDVVLCQQGVQFFLDRLQALREAFRVVRRGGTCVFAVWSAEREWGLFGPVVEVLAGSGLPEPYPGAFDPSTRLVGRSEATDLLTAAGWREVSAETVELEAVWPSVAAAVDTVWGMPFALLLAELPEERLGEIRRQLAERLPASPIGEVRVRTAATVARGTR